MPARNLKIGQQLREGGGSGRKALQEAAYVVTADRQINEVRDDGQNVPPPPQPLASYVLLCVGVLLSLSLICENLLKLFVKFRLLLTTWLTSISPMYFASLYGYFCSLSFSVSHSLRFLLSLSLGQLIPKLSVRNCHSKFDRFVPYQASILCSSEFHKFPTYNFVVFFLFFLHVCSAIFHARVSASVCYSFCMQFSVLSNWFTLSTLAPLTRSLLSPSRPPPPTNMENIQEAAAGTWPKAKTLKFLLMLFEFE